MARKHSAKSPKAKTRARPFNRKESGLKRWNKRSDIPLDEEEQFHQSKDMILLDGNEAGSDDEGDQDEVFALKGMSDESESDDEDDEEADEDEDMEDIEPQAPKRSTEKSKGKAGKKDAVPSSSSEAESESEEEGWGRKKSEYYASNAAEIDSEDEEANELEEQEAKRIQAKARISMADDDFGLGDTVETAVEPEDELAEPAPPPVVQNLPQDKQALLRHLEKTNPEALALARDWDDIAHSLVKSQVKLAKLEQDDPNSMSLGMAHLHYQALLTYATTLAFYLHLRASEQYAARPELLRTHPIMPRLLTLKQSLTTLEDLNFNLSDEDEDDDDDDDEDDDLDLDGFDEMADAMQLWKNNKKQDLDLNELESLLADANAAMAAREATASPKKKSLKDKAASAEEPPKKKRKTTSKAAADLPVFDLVEPEFPAKPNTSSRKSSIANADAYGEAAALDTADALDKAARKRMLQFHTAKIQSASARRDRARAGAGGDDDIPWKERKKAKEERNKKEVGKSRGQGGDDLDDEEPGPRESGGKKRGRDDDDEESGSDDEGPEGYYDLVKRKSREKKEKKKAEYDAAQAAARVHVDDDDANDGPRSLTRAILKNKGLTPHRGKSVRNPRVKKRQRFEKAKKKVSSQKAVYKGGISETGRYDGERSGISKVIKSVRL